MTSGIFNAHIDLRQAFEIELGLALHTPVQGADGNREEIDARLIDEASGLVDGGIRDLSRMAFSVLTFHPLDVIVTTGSGRNAASSLRGYAARRSGKNRGPVCQSAMPSIVAMLLLLTIEFTRRV